MVKEHGGDDGNEAMYSGDDGDEAKLQVSLKPVWKPGDMMMVLSETEKIW